MAPHRWKEIEELFHATAELPASERVRYLDQRSAEDLELRSEVEKLLASLDEADEFIESPVWTDSGLLNTSAKKELSKSLDENAHGDGFLGKQVGVYRLTREIGRGGMGAVFQAERADGEFNQTVAIKLIKRGMDTDFIVRRFRHERQILASFEHPYIARLLDGGTTTEGVPYFVMEFIEGETLFNYCDTNRLTVRDRLKLFQKICSALEYAHERQIVHRDIKPSNILINRSGSPKLLDFGIAKILDPDLIHESLNPTGSMLRMMTPDYASPEQVRGHDVTSVSDIYSLGILLYELVTGYRPYVFTGRALHEVTKVVCEEMPELPSLMIGSSGNLLPYYSGDVGRAADARATSQRELIELLKRGLDDVIMKALAKTAGGRFQSAAELSQDISRFLSGAEVSAPRYSSNGTAAKQKNTIPAKAIAVLPFKFLNLAAASETDDSFLGLGLADSLIARLSKIKRFLVRPTSSILAFGETLTDPIKAGKALKVDYIIDGNIKKAGERLRVSIQLLDVEENAAIWAASIDEQLADVLYLEDTLSGKVIEALLPQLTGSEIEEFGKRGTDVPEAFEQYLRGRYYFNSFTEDGLAKSFVAYHTAIAADPNYSLAYSGIADYYNWLGIMGVLPPKECYAPAIEAAQRAVDLDPESSEGHAVLGFAVHAGDYDWQLAEKHLKRAIELNPGNAQAHTWYSIVLLTEGRFDEGLELARRSVELDPLTPFNFHNIGWSLYYAGRFDESARQYEKLMRDFPDYVFGPYGLSKVFRKIGRTKDAIRFSDRALEVMGGSVFGLLNDAESYAADGQTEVAKQKLHHLLTMAEERYVSPYHLALIYSYLRDKDNAVAQLQKGLEVNDPWLNWMGVEPVFDFLRSDERFRHIQEQTGYRGLFETAQDPTTEPTLPQEQPIHDLTTIVIDESHVTTSGTQSRFASMPRKYLYAAVAGLLLLVIGIPAIYFYSASSGPQATRLILQQMPFQAPSVLILPFRSADENIGAGMSDALVQKLGAIRGLNVISASTGRSVASMETTELFKQLGTPFVMRGELSDSADGAVLNAEFVSAQDGTVMWTEVFKAKQGDYFELQCAAAERVWKTFNLELSPTELRQAQRSYTEDPRAYTQYLIGRSQMAARTSDGLKQAITSFSEAVMWDANFAPAYVGLADAYALLNLYDRTPPEAAYSMAKDFAKKALAIDESMGEAHASLAYVHFYYDRDRAAAELEFRRAIQMSPSYAQAHHWFALVLASTNKPIDAISEIKTAERLDPRSLSIKAASGIVHFFAGQNQQALAECDKALALQPTFLPAIKVKRWVYAIEGNWEEARKWFEIELTAANAKNTDPGWVIIESQLADLNPENKAAAIKKLEEAISVPFVKNNDFYYAFEIALAYIHLEETAKALDYIERAEASGAHSFNLIEADPRVNPLRKEQRYLKVVSKLHKTE